jgi:hypothetical protein
MVNLILQQLHVRVPIACINNEVKEKKRKETKKSHRVGVWVRVRVRVKKGILFLPVALSLSAVPSSGGLALLPSATCVAHL